MIFQAYFQHLYVINLPSRPDRRREMAAELARIGIASDDPNVTFYPAVRPDEPGGFPSIGARGCFLSHLGVLKDAKARGFERILLAEDDLSFTKDFGARVGGVVEALSHRPWDIFYGGHRFARVPETVDVDGLAVLAANEGVQTTHFLGFHGKTIGDLIIFLETVLTRRPGDPLGGPMHVDGAYTTFRRQNPDVVTLAAIPPLGIQRSSRSDIYRNAWFDRMPVVRELVALARNALNARR